MRLDDLSGRRVVVLGLGADVRAALAAVAAAGPAEVVAVEEGSGGGAPEIPRLDLSSAAAWGEVFVRSPGFPRYQRPLLQALERGASMTTPLDLWMGTHGGSRTVVGITGTKGKSTVTDLVRVLAEGAGLRIGVAGNLGVPVFDDGWDTDAPVVVLEVSSYQAADLHHVPDVAVVTFLAEDHLSWHGGVDRYVADKLRLVRNVGGTAGRVLVPVEGGRAAAALGALGVEPEVVVPPEAEATVPRHRVQNAALAGAVVAALGAAPPSASTLVEVARSSSLPGRLDPCPGPGSLLCVDDALASNPSATAAGLAWARSLGRPTVVLLGGADRGVDPGPLADEVAAWPVGMLRGVALPDSGAELATRCGLPLLAAAATMDDAVHVAVSSLSHGGVVLFSPAAPTPPGSGNWETRSAAFRAALGREPGGSARAR